VTDLDPGPADITEQPYRYQGVLTAGDDPDNHHGVPSRYCVVYCRKGRRRRHRNCPACYGPAVIFEIGMVRLDPVPGYLAQFAAWLGMVAGEWLTAFMDALVFPFHRTDTAEVEREELIELAARGDQES
jgi:hypothetical protein